MDSAIGIPQQATKAVRTVEELIGHDPVAAYLFGSAVVGSLRVDSDVDVLVLIDRPLASSTRQALVTRLLGISGAVGGLVARPLELTVVNRRDVVPWRYPPRSEFVYGEWLREAFEQGQVPGPDTDPDLVIVLAKVRQASIPLRGRDARRVLEPVPKRDLLRALEQSLPSLVDGLPGDERNGLLTLARMWVTAATGDIVPKDAAADWALERLPAPLVPTLDLARKGYRGEIRDNWSARRDETAHLSTHLRQRIEACLRATSRRNPG